MCEILALVYVHLFLVTIKSCRETDPVTYCLLVSVCDYHAVVLVGYDIYNPVRFGSFAVLRATIISS